MYRHATLLLAPPVLGSYWRPCFAYLPIQVVVSTPLVWSSFRKKISQKKSQGSFWGPCGFFLKFYRIQKVNVFWEGHKIRKNIPYLFDAVCNHIKLVVSLRVLYCVVDTGYGLGRYLGDCRPALTKGRKYQIWLKHKLRAMLGCQ